MTPSPDPLSLSRTLLEGVKRGADTADSRRRLAALDTDALLAALDTDARRLAFWCNVYNGYAQHLLDADPGRWDRRWLFFRRSLVPVAGRSLSLDDIEHGVLRRSMSSLGLGYLPRLRPSEFERRARVDERDPRIHFALNCGAASCPPVASYDADAVDNQLDLAAGGYLDATVEYDDEADVARVPRLLLWYRGDFGGRSGVIDFLREYDAIPVDASPTLRYLGWDWSLSRGGFEERSGSEEGT
ncbi:DUF547 domain-containing protein [Halobium salinum]|uniref:DUF547 domain-containing protein n=1 Tax=Halobium salinum TaxID=1364940 RepID=A0ABD5P7B2_9EURY|nr:DUF547 domain-containing protein [Halobium salinum]